MICTNELLAKVPADACIGVQLQNVNVGGA